MRKLYKEVRKRLPRPVQAQLTRLLYSLSGKPFYKKDNIPLSQKYPGGEKGGMILSADFELAWAFRYSKEFDNPYESSLEKAHQARKNFPTLLNLFEKYDIPVTWATVGHLFLKECSKDSHDSISRLPYFHNRCWIYDKGDWFDHDPHTNWKEDPEWYAPDLIDMILSSNVDHEMGTHTFSHIDFSYKNCPPEVADDEMKACIEVMKPLNLTPVSICFPSGSFGNVEALKNNGIRIYRKKLKDDVVAYPYYDEHGLLVTPTSETFVRLHESWSANYYTSRFIKSLDKAVKSGTIAHFMFHPSFDEWTLNNVMPIVLEYAAKLRDKGDLWIGTMENIADHIDKDSTVTE